MTTTASRRAVLAAATALTCAVAPLTGGGAASAAPRPAGLISPTGVIDGRGREVLADVPAPAVDPTPPEAVDRARERTNRRPDAVRVEDLTTSWNTSPRTGADHRAAALRLDGPDRIAVSVAVSRRAFPGRASVVYLTRQDVLSDALVAGTLSGGPILLTPPDRLDPRVAAEITRLGNPRVVVIGGAASVRDAVARAASRGRPYDRLAGADRIETSVAVARHAFPRGAAHAYLAPTADAAGGPPSDAVPAGSVTDGPILYVDARRGPSASVRSLMTSLGVREIHQLGWRSLGTKVSDRIGSFDRYGTSVAIAEHVSAVGPKTVYLTRGAVFADAVSAGSLTDGPVVLTETGRLPRAVCTYLRRAVPAQVVALGGTAAVSASVLAEAQRCASRGTYPIFSRYEFHPVSHMPYVGPGTVTPNRTCKDTLPPDEGLHVRIWDGRSVFHPVSLAAGTLRDLMEYEAQPRTAQGCRFLNIARNNARAFLSSPHRVRVGSADFYEYDFPVYIGGVREKYLAAPWFSGMGQGHMLSLFSRLYRIDGDPVWRDAARAAFDSFTVPRRAGRPWVTTTDANGRIWFEEYAGDSGAPLVVNGHVFAIFGMYDYWYATGDARARVTMDAGASTLLAAVPEFRNPGGRSFYCTENPHCQHWRWTATKHYHEVVVDQLDVMARMTGDARFGTAAAALRADA